MGEGTREVRYVDAGVEALQGEMQRDETIVYIGQGIGPRGGTFVKPGGSGKSLVMTACAIPASASWELRELRLGQRWPAAGLLLTKSSWTSLSRP